MSNIINKTEVLDEKRKVIKSNKTSRINVGDSFSSEEMKHATDIERIIGYEFNNMSILINALSHIGYNIKNHIDADSYQRMEYLGDALLDFIVADELYHKYPSYDEGVLTKLKIGRAHF